MILRRDDEVARLCMPILAEAGVTITLGYDYKAGGRIVVVPDWAVAVVEALCDPARDGPRSPADRRVLAVAILRRANQAPNFRAVVSAAVRLDDGAQGRRAGASGAEMVLALLAAEGLEKSDGREKGTGTGRGDE